MIRGNGVVGLRRGQDSFGAGKLNSSGKGVQLLHGGGFSQTQIHHVRNQRGHAVIAQGIRPHEFRNR